MRGSLQGREIAVRYGQRSANDGINVIEIRTNHPLLLGLKLQVSAPPKAPNGRFAGVGQTVLTGIEQERVNSMFLSTEAGRASLSTIRKLGALGWAQLTDSRIRTQSEIYVDAAEGYVRLIQSVLQALVLAEAAREELEPVEWEINLQRAFQLAAGDLQLALRQRDLAVGGAVRRVPVDVHLRATDHYAITAEAKFPKPLPTGTFLMKRSGVWSRFAALVGIDKPTQDRAFNREFRINSTLLPRLSGAAIADLLELSRGGEVRIDEDAVRYQTAALRIDLGRLTLQLVRVVEQIAGHSEGAPYR
jgi:hypothetical protein